jgi:3-hydroxyisobutyrate dehydrogenase
MSDVPQHRAQAGGSTVLFVGLGAMGEPVSANLANAGHEVLLADARTGHAATLAASRSARSVPLTALAEAAASVSAVILMLPDSRAVSQVLEGPDGLLAHLAPGATVIDMSSSAPSETVRLAEAAQQRDIELIDAPVSGGVSKAVTGELSIMVGAEPQQFERVSALLAAMGNDVIHVGPVGAGHAMKALNNLLSAIGLIAASEVLAAGTKYGLDPQTMIDVLNGSTGGNHATKVKMSKFVLSRKFDSGFAMSLMVKDLRTALQIAHDTGTPVPMSAACLEEWSAAAQTLGPQADHTHISAYVEGRSGVTLESALDQTTVGGSNDQG